MQAHTGYAAGDGGTILKTTDGGANWAIQTTPTTEGLRGLHFVDQDTGYAVGYAGTLLKTTDGGGNWVRQKAGSADQLHRV